MSPASTMLLSFSAALVRARRRARVFSGLRKTGGGIHTIGNDAAQLVVNVDDAAQLVAGLDDASQLVGGLREGPTARTCSLRKGGRAARCHHRRSPSPAMLLCLSKKRATRCETSKNRHVIVVLHPILMTRISDTRFAKGWRRDSFFCKVPWEGQKSSKTDPQENGFATNRAAIGRILTRLCQTVRTIFAHPLVPSRSRGEAKA